MSAPIFSERAPEEPSRGARIDHPLIMMSHHI
jgi:hypothetical protein